MPAGAGREDHDNGNPHEEIAMNYQRFAGPAAIFVAAQTVAAILGVPVFTYLPIAVVALACPLMMVFMMRGMSHGAHASGSHDQPPAVKDGEGR
jgi:hypothetical protein